jgi:protein SCO1/2
MARLAHALTWITALSLALGSTASAQGKGAGYLPNIPLTTHDGEAVRFYDDLVKDKVVVVNFIYTSCPDTCPAETAKLIRVREELGDRVGQDIFMYSISIDPEHDTPEVLKAYREKFQIQPGWTFLTGDEDDIVHLRKKLGVYMEEIQDDSGNHNVTFVVGNDRTGKWISRSPFDNPKILAKLIGHDLFDGVRLVSNRPQRIVRADAKPYIDVPPAPQYSMGERLFVTRCRSCHNVGGPENMLGPDLLGVTERRERAWLSRWLKEPDKMLQEQDPIAMELFHRYNEIAMPNLRLEDAEVAALIEHLEAESRRVGGRLAKSSEPQAP